uniref:Uncharacterized protein n=1 Tax=Trichogramma kaykai TaxID=54128 RepID=A0ABD2VUJ5_9HYME
MHTKFQHVLTKIQSLWRQGWIEIPEVMASSGLALIGITLSIGSYLYQDPKGWNLRYLNKELILRPDDPRVSRIKKTGVN